MRVRVCVFVCVCVRARAHAHAYAGTNTFAKFQLQAEKRKCGKQSRSRLGERQQERENLDTKDAKHPSKAGWPGHTRSEELRATAPTPGFLLHIDFASGGLCGNHIKQTEN